MYGTKFRKLEVKNGVFRDFGTFPIFKWFFFIFPAELQNSVVYHMKAIMVKYDN